MSNTTLLQDAHYFVIAELETKCDEILVSILVSTLDIECNFSSIVTFDVEQKLDLLFMQCLE